MAERKLVGVREAARALNVSASTISRGVGKHFANYGTASQPLVDLEEVRDARRNRLEPERQAAAYAARGMSPPPLPADSEADDSETDLTEAGAGGRAASTSGDLGRERLRMVRNQADRVEMDNLERQRELAPAADFADAGVDLALLLRRILAARVRVLVAAIEAAKGSGAVITQAIRESDQACEAALAVAVEILQDGKAIEDTGFGAA